MSFRIEEKLFIKSDNLIQFQENVFKKSYQKIHHPRLVESLYFDNIKLEMHTDSIEGLTPRKKIRIRKYPNDTDSKYYLEIKNSSVEGRFKTRKIINEQELNKTISTGIYDNQYGSCYPKLYVKYKRDLQKISYFGKHLHLLNKGVSFSDTNIKKLRQAISSASSVWSTKINTNRFCMS